MSPAPVQDLATAARAALAGVTAGADELLALFEACRRAGLIVEAGELLQRATALGAGPPPTAIRPAPLVRIADVLQPAAQDALWALIKEALPAFKPSAIGKVSGELEGVRSTERQSLILAESLPLWRFVQPHVEKALAGDGILEALDVIIPSEAACEVQVTVHGDGGFYARHIDNAPGATAARVVSFVYYLHSRPKRFEGGDLILYDGDLTLGQCSSGAFTRVPPDDNTLILFPSGVLHEVLPVAMPGLGLIDGRFTINGWVRAQPPPAVEGTWT